MEFKISEKFDPAPLAKILKTKGHVQVSDFLEADSAEAMYQCLWENCVWQWAYYDGAKRETMSGQQIQNMMARRKTDVMKKIYGQAQHQFQQLLMECRFGDDGEELPAEKAANLAPVKAFLGSDPFRDAVNAVTGGKDELSDLHAIWQNRDLFRCDTVDAPDNPESGAIFMLDLAKDWRPDWGGTLGFPDENGSYSESYPPGFNVLNIIAAPARHSLSYIAPFVDGFRLSLWGQAE